MHHPRRTWIAVVPLLLGAAPTLAQGGSLVERNSPLQVVEPDAADRELRTTPVVRAVQRAADSVVSIYLQQQQQQAARREPVPERREPVTEGQGSGVILDENGLVITNWHVVAPVVLGESRRGELDVVVKLRDGRSRQAQVLSSSATRDLALLQLRLQDGEKVKPIEIGRSSDLMIGETVVAIGNPQGHANTVTSGVLSAIDRSIRVRAPDGALREYAGLLQTDAAINQGNSGGALLDITGRLIGINNAMAVGAENIGFAIPMDTVREEFQRELIQSASFAAAADAPWLGLEIAERDGVVTISEVMPGSPADDAGVRVGDVLARVGEHEVRTSLDFVRHGFSASTRSELPLLLRRAGRELRVAPVPMTRDQGVLLATIGAALEEVTVEQDRDLVVQTTRAFWSGRRVGRLPLLPAALRFQKLLPEAPAAEIGLEPGDVLVSVFVPYPVGVREEPVGSRRDLARLLEQLRGNSVRISILREGKVMEGMLDVRRAARR